MYCTVFFSFYGSQADIRFDNTESECIAASTF